MKTFWLNWVLNSVTVSWVSFLGFNMLCCLPPSPVIFFSKLNLCVFLLNSVFFPRRQSKYGFLSTKFRQLISFRDYCRAVNEIRPDGCVEDKITIILQIHSLRFKHASTRSPAETCVLTHSLFKRWNVSWVSRCLFLVSRCPWSSGRRVSDWLWWEEISPLCSWGPLVVKSWISPSCSSSLSPMRASAWGSSCAWVQKYWTSQHSLTFLYSS